MNFFTRGALAAILGTAAVLGTATHMGFSGYNISYKPGAQRELSRNLRHPIANADEVVDMHDDPATVLHKRKNSSMVVGLKMLADGQGDAFVSAGSTGARTSTSRRDGPCASGSASATTRASR